MSKISRRSLFSCSLSAAFSAAFGLSKGAGMHVETFRAAGGYVSSRDLPRTMITTIGAGERSTLIVGKGGRGGAAA